MKESYETWRPQAGNAYELGDHHEDCLCDRCLQINGLAQLVGDLDDLFGEGRAANKEGGKAAPSNVHSTQHPHEPEIPPAFDSEGRCLVCCLIVERDDARAKTCPHSAAWKQRVREAARKWADRAEEAGVRGREQLYDAADEARAAFERVLEGEADA
jgi:hypothetical protein